MQFCYTYAFGAYATYLLLRTGHAAAPLLPHAFCNWAGLPRFGAMGGRTGVLAALAVGIAAFALGLVPMTRPGLYNNDPLLYGCWGSLDAAERCVRAAAARGG